MTRGALSAVVGLALCAAAHAGDAERGAILYESRCGACHSLQTDRIGPRHAGIAGRRAGSIDGFAYSPALAKAGFVWDAVSLDRWLADPEALVPGQRMGFRVGDAGERADIVAFLMSLR